MDPGTAQYNFPVFVRLTGELDVGLLHRAVAEIVRRHEVLRTVITTRDGQPFQTLLPAEPPALPLTDLTSYPPERREPEARRLAREQYAEPFDLATGPVLRAGLLRLGPADHVLLLTAHHVTVDGWSAAVLLGELAELYTAGREQRPPRLAELPVQYADYAVWQRRLAEAGHFDRLVEHWTAHLRASSTCRGCPWTGRARRTPNTGARACASASRPRPRTGCARCAGRRTAPCSWRCSPRCTRW